MPTSSTCAACGADGLRPKIRIREPGQAENLIPTTERFGSALADIVRCPRCGHMQLDPMPDRELLEHAYGEAESDAYVEEEAGQRETARRALERIERFAPQRGMLLDLGCWVGFLMAEARDRGWRVLGVEPSRFASAYAREQLGLEVITGDLLESPLPAGRFDAVTMGDVIEHLPDPLGALERIRSLLAPGGVLWLALPDAGSGLARALGRRWWSVLPTHVHYFTRGSLATLLPRGGFDVLEVSTAPKVFTVQYYLSRIRGYSPPIGDALARAASAGGWGGRLWGPDFRDRMAVIARRRP